MYYAKNQYSVTYLESITRHEWLKMDVSLRSDIRLALSESIVYSKGLEKERLFKLKSKLIDFSMNSQKEI